MCELLLVKSNKPVPVESVLAPARLLDEYGVAGFGWGMVWRTESGELQRYRSVDGLLRDTLAARALAGVVSSTYLVHLRRPSAMTTIAHRNAQPYLQSDRSYAFAHNGFFAEHKEYRAKFAAQLEGTSDSEVGFCYYQSLLEQQAEPLAALVETHRVLGGKANVGVIRQSGELLVYAGNRENRVYTFQVGELQMAATALHSADDFLFQTVFPAAEQMECLPLQTGKSL